jgi:hypothetical protein
VRHPEESKQVYRFHVYRNYVYPYVLVLLTLKGKRQRSTKNSHSESSSKKGQVAVTFFVYKGHLPTAKDGEAFVSLLF